MDAAQAADILAKHNRWRRDGDDNEATPPSRMGDPTLIGEAIDAAVAALTATHEDTLRLDYIDNLDCGFDHVEFGEYKHHSEPAMGRQKAFTARAAIDKARRQAMVAQDAPHDSRR